jgi:hypothetical protein
MSLIVSFGKWGGVYFHHGAGIRLCLGWMAITVLFMDIDVLLNEFAKLITIKPSYSFRMCKEGWRLGAEFNELRERKAERSEIAAAWERYIAHRKTCEYCLPYPKDTVIS